MFAVCRSCVLGGHALCIAIVISLPLTVTTRWWFETSFWDLYLGRRSNLTTLFQLGWKNQQDHVLAKSPSGKDFVRECGHVFLWHLYFPWDTTLQGATSLDPSHKFMEKATKSWEEVWLKLFFRKAYCIVSQFEGGFRRWLLIFTLDSDPFFLENEKNRKTRNARKARMKCSKLKVSKVIFSCRGPLIFLDTPSVAGVSPSLVNSANSWDFMRFLSEGGFFFGKL